MGKLKLTDQQVQEIRVARQQGETFKSIADRFGVNPTTAFQIVHYRIRKKSRSEMFWSHVHIGKPNECWDWKGATLIGGYGYAFRHTRAHRFAYESKYGKIPHGMSVLHKCDNPACCNPKHLFLGTNQDNTNDMIAKGRFNCGRGSKQGSSKLTESKVIEIRKMKEEGVSPSEIARRFGVKVRNIFHIINRETWKHV